MWNDRHLPERPWLIFGMEYQAGLRAVNFKNATIDASCLACHSRAFLVCSGLNTLL